MGTLLELKEAESTLTPLLLFDCSFSDGTKKHWCTQALTLGSSTYEPRVCHNNLFEVQTASDQGVDTIPKLTLELANADSVISELERAKGFKGARLTCSFVFYDLVNKAIGAEPIVLFQGVFNSPELITETAIKITAINRLSAQRVVLPSLRIQRRCAWDFPATADERAEAVEGGSRGQFSRFYSCGYSADQLGGVGNLNGNACYTSCSFTRQDCEARGMFKTDGRGNATGRFSGVEFVPSTIAVRSAGERGSHLSPISVNEARYNDFIPLVYGTAWYTPSIVFARNDGNLTRLEVLLGVGEMTALHKVLVSDIEIPLGQSGLNMTGTGWFNVVTLGTRNGVFNKDFTDSTGNPLGDPYGGIALLSVVVPNRINDGKSLPEVKVLVDGLKLARYGTNGTPLPNTFTNNPAWILLDVLLRNGWNAEEIDFASFAVSADFCDEQIDARDLHGNAVKIPRFQCNLVLKSRRSAGDVLRGIRNASRLFLTFGTGGMLQLRTENTIAAQQSTKSELSNSAVELNGGWPVYEFGDGTQGTSGILRNADGSSTLRLSSRGASDTPNRMAVEFQDGFNEFQQDSFSLSDADDVAKAGQEINSTPSVLGLPNYHQAARTLQFLLSKSITGNRQVEFQTSVKALGITPGDIVALTYLREGFQRQAFRVVKVAPGQNFRTVGITAQIHDDRWYSDIILDNFGNGRRLPAATSGIPRPISGLVADLGGTLAFRVTESSNVAQDGTASVLLDVEVAAPPALADTAPTIPIVGLTPDLAQQAGALVPSQTLYYAVSGVDVSGNEGLLSFVVRATLPSSGLGYTVTLKQLSFSAATDRFNVYRGVSPIQMNRIATSVAVAAEFIDNGLLISSELPPDTNFHHSNLYWRLESEGEVNAAIHSPLTIGNNILRMRDNAYAGFAVHILGGKGAGQEKLIGTNSQTTLTVTSAWSIEPDASSVFVVSQAAFQDGASGKGSHFQFEVPNREGTVVQILGRSANAAGAECPSEISPLTRWTIGGAGIRTVDLDIPAAPSFSLGLSHRLDGSLELSGIGFSDLSNTGTIVAGTLTIYWQDELTRSHAILLTGGVSDVDLTVNLSLPGISVGDICRIDGELVTVDQVLSGGSQASVSRGMFSTTPAAHALNTEMVILRKSTVTVPFVKHFFGTPASGDWAYPIPVKNARVSAAEFYVTNSQGNSGATIQAYTNTLDLGLRTLAGGQYSLQVSGPLAIQDSAAPDSILEADHVIGDVRAFLSGAATGSQVSFRVNLNSMELCVVQFDAGAVVSTSLRGAVLPVLRQGDRLSVDVLDIGNNLPGNDLTVVITV